MGSVLIWDQESFSGENGRATIPPWLADPFRLISWLTMKKFSALSFYLMGNSLGMMRCLADSLNRDPGKWPEGCVRVLSDAAEKSSSACKNVGLRLSAKALQRFAAEISENWSADTLIARVETIKDSIGDELEDHLFLWVP